MGTILYARYCHWNNEQMISIEHLVSLLPFDIVIFFTYSLSMETVLIIAHTLGIICAGAALWRTRTPQGAAAWVVALLAMPIVFIPLFLIFGRNRFYGYVRRRQIQDKKTQEGFKEFERLFKKEVKNPSHYPLVSMARATHQLPFTSHNEVKLLVDGHVTYEAMLNSIREAREYILFQSYIFKMDDIGEKFLQALSEKSKSGVRVYIQFDKVGSKISKKVIKQLKVDKIEFCYFYSTKSWLQRFQINFRNHRKVLVVDGQVAFVGGFNVGNEYLSLDKKIGYWRDTHIKITGAGAIAAQVSFLKDWSWVSGDVLDVNWDANKVNSTAEVMVLHTGPADDYNSESCLFAHLTLINNAKEKVWVATPYFIPPESLSHALKLAVLRGVDVRIIIPVHTDNPILAQASTVYVEQLLEAGIKFYRYMPGFAHQKVLLTEQAAIVGSVNLDNRSFFINFEIMAIVEDRKFQQEVENMLSEDLKNSLEVSIQDFKRFTILRKFIARVVNLVSPML